MEGEATCNFCPDGLQRQYWENEIPFIGSNATCFKLNQFFLNYQLPESDANCQLALNFNYICDCEGPGYAGADNDTKRMALVWVPRVSAILSIIGSCAIIIDVLRDKKKRHKLYCQLMVSMSIFDLMGSVAYSLTTLPIPKGEVHSLQCAFGFTNPFSPQYLNAAKNTTLRVQKVTRLAVQAKDSLFRLVLPQLS